MEIETGRDEINFPRSFAISPDGDILVVANQLGNSTTVSTSQSWFFT